MSEIHYQDIGTAFRATIKDEDDVVVDVSSYTSLLMKFKRPDGTNFSKESSLTNDGTDGIIEYVTVSGDLNAIGMWTVQGYVELSNGSWHSDCHEFRVHRNIS